jgi:hypothetical protein
MRVSNPRARSMPRVSISSLRKGGLRLGVHQQHAVFVQPDLPRLGAKMHASAQILAGGTPYATEFGHGLTLSVSTPRPVIVWVYPRVFVD